MKLPDFERLIQRIRRLRKALVEKGGLGFQYKYTFPDGETYTYILRNLKSPEVIEDEVAHCYVWLWSLKDYPRDF